MADTGHNTHIVTSMDVDTAPGMSSYRTFLGHREKDDRHRT